MVIAIGQADVVVQDVDAPMVPLDTGEHFSHLVLVGGVVLQRVDPYPVRLCVDSDNRRALRGGLASVHLAGKDRGGELVGVGHQRLVPAGHENRFDTGPGGEFATTRADEHGVIPTDHVRRGDAQVDEGRHVQRVE